MKILHIISGDLWAGAEVQAFTQLVALRTLDVQVAVAVMNEGELAKNLRECGIDVTVLPEATMNGLTILFGLCKLIRNFRPDVVHTHRLKENIFGSIAARLIGATPSVRTVHGATEHKAIGLRRIHKRFFNYLNRWTAAHIQKKIIAVSDELGEKLATEIPYCKIVVIENGVDIDAVRAQVRPIEFRLSAPNTTHVGIVGRLVPVKRVDLFLQTTALLRERVPQREWQFHIFGDGPLRSALENQAKQLNVADITIFHGHRQDIVACIAALDCLIMCSDHEGLPMTLLEAMAVGTPVIGHSTGSIQSILSEVESSLVVTNHSPSGYAEAATTLLTSGVDSTLQTRLLQSVKTHYSALHNAEQVHRIYQQIIAKASPL